LVPRKSKLKAAGKLPDIRTVAALAKVSIATVSRTINGSPLVSDRLSKRVWQAIKQLNYLPNTHARTLVSGRSRLLGIIVENITNPFFPELIQSFEEIAVAGGYEILVSSTNSDPAVLAACARRMLERKVDGVAVMTFGEEEPVLDQLVNRGVPIVLAEFKLDDPKASTIVLDYSTGIHAAIRHLADLGHRDLGFLAGPYSLHSAITRENDFRAAIEAAGLPLEKKWIIECDHTLKGGVAGFEQLRKLAVHPTAIVCSNDMTAIGVQHALFEANLKVPEDFSLVGFDDIHLAEYTIPPLTTVRMSCKDLALAAVNSLLAQIQHNAEPTTLQAQPIVPTHLIVRQTTGLPKNALSDLNPKTAKKPRR
jgi:LacI family transcriptional regulator